MKEAYDLFKGDFSVRLPVSGKLCLLLCLQTCLLSIVIDS